MREGGGACKLAFDLPVNPIVGLSVCLFSGHHVDEEMLLLLQPTYGMTMTGAERGREGVRDSQSDTDRDCHTSWWQIYESRDPKKERTRERTNGLSGNINPPYAAAAGAASRRMQGVHAHRNGGKNNFDLPGGLRSKVTFIWTPCSNTSPTLSCAKLRDGKMQSE